MKALGFMLSEKNIVLCFPIIRQLELSVTMETRVLIRSGPNPIAAVPHPNDALDKIWLRSAHWLRIHIYIFESVDRLTDGHTDAGSMGILFISSPCEPSAQVS